MKFIHTADIHLDSPLVGLAKYDGAPIEEIRRATRDALDNLVLLAVEEEVNFILIAGDVYDGDWKDHNTGLFFSSKMSELRRAGIKVFLISGNHDAQNVMTKRLQLPENVTRFPTKKPGTEILEDIRVAIHGQGFHTRSVTDNLVTGYPAAIPDYFNIGILHTSLTGREGHDDYAPCTVEDLVRLGYDFWALGHVHMREEVNEEPPMWFPGNIQGRHIKETGAKGCSLVTVAKSGDITIEFAPLDLLRWELLTIDCTELDDLNACLDTFRIVLNELIDASEERLLAIRVIVTGESHAHQEISSKPLGFMNELRSIAIDCGGGNVWIEKVRIQTSPPLSFEGNFDPDGPIAELFKVVESIAGNEEARQELMRAIEPIMQKLPPELVEGDDAVGLSSPEGLSSILGQVSPLLLSRIRKEKPPS